VVWDEVFLPPVFRPLLDGMLVVLYTALMNQNEPDMKAVLFPVIHVLVGLLVTYAMVASFVNKTDVTISPTTFTVRSYPLKWLGDRSVAVAEVDQLYTARKVTRSKNGTSVSYQLRVIMKRENEFKLFGGQASKEECLTLEEEIESIIGLQDRMVEGEV
jgi:hypothetical protein|tara:strand:- start:7522 stop:7998 length:477 start_codon:yes stop_codon:yes gene_type:complete